MFFIFTPDPWGNDPIWRLHIFQLGQKLKPPTISNRCHEFFFWTVARNVTGFGHPTSPTPTSKDSFVSYSRRLGRKNANRRPIAHIAWELQRLVYRRWEPLTRVCHILSTRAFHDVEWWRLRKMFFFVVFFCLPQFWSFILSMHRICCFFVVLPPQFCFPAKLHTGFDNFETQFPALGLLLFGVIWFDS